MGRERVYTSGVFDLFHVGHLQALKKAKTFGDYLIVGVASDEFTASYKRPPVIPFKERMAIVKELSFINEVITDPCPYNKEFYENYNISVHCQGDDCPGFDFYDLPKSLGIFKTYGRFEGVSSSKIIEKIKAEF
jgi:cytidyltransferase-like protein